VFNRDEYSKQKQFTRVWQRIEISTQQQLYGRLMMIQVTIIAISFLQYSVQFIGQHHDLYELDIAELRIPVDVRGANKYWLLDF